ncbi:DUF2244 domain-containing protein [Cohaesibacter sp. CAU 1516]|uniref:DUF2244 domain-containing protein n=1 Tax=Cohaesibacter sp. CAU 1516 TaxID=2576038 RepID=UPI0010FE2673|nr:DUF2244 domain-containing protein [Cohaesibacter sp. CAU 1516]TLP47099.1 DUF2244 domain-containing protein [Cohaesibacter sp. CAU 1516]
MAVLDEATTQRFDETEPYFDAILHPYRSLGRNGFIGLMIFVGLLLLIVSIPFYLMGAWPILGFAGLDILLLWWAFRRNYRDARATEQIRITQCEVSVIRTCPRGRQSHMSFNPYWVRMETREEEDRGMTELHLTSHGKRVEIGAFLHACERESLAGALKSALMAAKTGCAQVSGG